MLSKPLWESAFFADFHQRRQFPQASVFFFFCFFFLSLCLSLVFHRKIARQDPLGATIAHSIDPQHPRLLSLPSSLAAFFLFQRSAETVGLRARLDDVGLVGQPVQHRLT